MKVNTHLGIGQRREVRYFIHSNDKRDCPGKDQKDAVVKSPSAILMRLSDNGSFEGAIFSKQKHQTEASETQ